MLKYMLGNKMVVANVLMLVASIAGISASPEQINSISAGVIALLAVLLPVVNGVAHHRAGKMGVQPDDSTDVRTGGIPTARGEPTDVSQSRDLGGA